MMTETQIRFEIVYLKVEFPFRGERTGFCKDSRRDPQKPGQLWAVTGLRSASHPLINSVCPGETVVYRGMNG